MVSGAQRMQGRDLMGKKGMRELLEGERVAAKTGSSGKLSSEEVILVKMV